MATSAGQTDFQSLFSHARRQVIAGPAGVREVRLALDGPPLRARSKLVTSGPLLFVHGENLAGCDLTLRYDGRDPQVVVHTSLAGSATAVLDDLGTAITRCPGEIQLFGAPTSRATVRLQAHVRNEAFRIRMEPLMLAGLAARYPQLETVAGRLDGPRPFCLPPAAPTPLPRLVDQVAEIMDSDHYGEVRPLFLESRALGWLAMALTVTMASPSVPGNPGGLPRREVERMHQARDLLQARLATPPSLGEVAAAVGTNDFALKRNFKAVFGQPVHGYLLDRRLAHACALLRETDQAIKAIATAVGYMHPNHFSTAFHRRYGLTPAQYRRRV
jgi:AraC-like DNA-binding protein